MKTVLKYTLFFFLVFHSLLTISQEQVELLHADVIYYNKKLVDAQRLLGNVHFVRDGTHLYCDSAYCYAKKDFTAFGNIWVEKKGGFHLTGKEMYYRNAENKAVVNGNVILNDGDMTLTAPKIEYFLENKSAHYSGGGKIISKTKKDVLTSQSGIYYSEMDLFHFEKNVKILHEKYTLKTSKLDYEYNEEIAHFIAPTVIESENQKVECQAGFFNSKTQIGELYQRPTVTYESSTLIGDTIFFNADSGYGKALHKVEIRDTNQTEIIFGHYAEHFEKTGENLITKNPRIAELMDSDTLWIQADTLWMLKDSVMGNQLKGYHHVVMYHPDFQGKCDSVFFNGTDSILTLFYAPIFWMENRQMTGDTIDLHIVQNKIDHFNGYENGFMISQVSDIDSIHFDQVKGRKMTGYFVNNELTHLDIIGNGQLLYFPKEKETDKKSFGMNKGDCSEISISIFKRKIKKISLKNKPDSYFIPIQQTENENKKLPHFNWRIKEKPNKSCIKK
jgi:lipopolysaccharide export system protein LptA